MTDVYAVIAAPNDGTPIELRKHWVARNGFFSFMRRSIGSARWAMGRAKKGLPIPGDHEMTPDQIKEMEWDTPE